MTPHPTLETCLTTLPHEPGVYRMLDINGTILYVGKAQDLKKRVSQYFQKTITHPKTLALVQRIHTIEVTVTKDEREALLLENHLIKTLQPKYNILLRDDKSYPYLLLQTDHPFPSIRLYRGKSVPKKGRLFGPYLNTAAVHATLNMLQKCFELRQCQDSVFRGRSRPCLQYQMKRCSAPCTQFISQKDYAHTVQQAIDFLEGHSDALIHTLTETLEACIQTLDFEKAAKIRDQIQQLRQIQTNAENVMPWLTMTTTPAYSLAQPFEKLTEVLGTPYPIQHIECFDVSHTQGSSTIAACVVFHPTGPDKAAYRQYTITDITPGDDYAALRAALLKRYQSTNTPLPDLILIDGGPKQVKIATEVLTLLNLTHIHHLGITKGLRRAARYDRIYDPYTAQFLSFSPHDPARLLLQRIRDEAHRFAIKTHRKKREKVTQHSRLEDIEGIGPTRRRALLVHFGGLQGLRSASYEALCQVPGISPTLAKRILKALQSFS